MVGISLANIPPHKGIPFKSLLLGIAWVVVAAVLRAGCFIHGFMLGSTSYTSGGSSHGLPESFLNVNCYWQGHHCLV